MRVFLVAHCANSTFCTDDAHNPNDSAVMGGKSTGSFTVSDGAGVLQGEVKDVPSLGAPGFLAAR